MAIADRKTCTKTKMVEVTEVYIDLRLSVLEAAALRRLLGSFSICCDEIKDIYHALSDILPKTRGYLHNIQEYIGNKPYELTENPLMEDVKRDISHSGG